MQNVGQFGGVVKRKCKILGVLRNRGSTLTAEELDDVPLQNRIALRNQNYVKFLEEPKTESKTSSEEQETSPKTKTASPSKKKASKKTTKRKQRESIKKGMMVKFTDDDGNIVEGEVVRKRRTGICLIRPNNGDMATVHLSKLSPM